MVGSEEGGKGGGGVTVGADRPCFLEAFQSSSQQVARSTGRTVLYSKLSCHSSKVEQNAVAASARASSGPFLWFAIKSAGSRLLSGFAPP